jgi:hypothetical protein
MFLAGGHQFANINVIYIYLKSAAGNEGNW